MTDSPPLILVADDDRDVLEALRLLLRSEGYAVESAASPSAVLAAVGARDFAAAIVDMNYTRDTTGGAEGLDLIARLQRADATLPVIVMTAWGSIEGAVEAIRRGARDYVEKPFNNARLLHILRTQVELGQAIRRGQQLEVENLALRRPAGSPKLVAESGAMQSVLRLISRIAPSDAGALITGEHGTGKEVVAHWIHAASSRAARAMITVNVGGLAEGVFEAELFGHVKGAYTDAKTDRVGRFELADGGTLFLDEIGNLTLGQQATLLRVLQTGELERVGGNETLRVDVRVIAATNRPLPEMVQAREFRADLYYRLAVFPLELPPLSARREDIPILARQLIEACAKKIGVVPPHLDEQTIGELQSYSWPGNVRELQNVIERAVILSRGGLLDVAPLLEVVPREDARVELAGDADANEAAELRAALDAARWVIEGEEGAAARLGLRPSTLRSRMRRLGIERPR